VQFLYDCVVSDRIRSNTTTSLFVDKFTEQCKCHVGLSLEVVLLSDESVQSWVTEVSTSRRTWNAGIKLEILVQAEFPSKSSLEIGVRKHLASFSNVCYYAEAVSKCFALCDA